MLANPCCCDTLCNLGQDFFNRADNADINVGAPWTYNIVSGTWSIASSRLAVASTNAKVLLPEIAGSTATNLRKITVIAKGDTGDAIRFYVGSYYYEVIVGVPGSVGIYNAATDALVMIRQHSIASQATLTVDFAQGPVFGDSSSGTYSGITYNRSSNYLSIPADAMAGPAVFGLGTGAVAAAVTFDNLVVRDNDVLSTATDAGTGACVLNGVLCLDVEDRWAGTSLSPDWEEVSGTWARLAATKILRCTAAGTARYIGLFAGQPIDARVTFTLQSSQEASIWLDEGETGVEFTKDGLGNTEAELFISGVSQGVILTVLNDTPGFRIDMAAYAGRLHLFLQHTAAGGADIIKSYEYTSTLAETFAIDVSGGAGNRDFVINDLRQPFSPGSHNDCGRGAEGSATSCTGALPVYDLTFDEVDGTCGDLSDGAANINGVTFRTDANRRNRGTVNSCEKMPYIITAQWIGTVYDGNTFSVITTGSVFVVHLQVGDAWARFEKVYTAPLPACNSLSAADIPLVDHYNAGDFDMSAATCTADAV